MMRYRCLAFALLALMLLSRSTAAQLRASWLLQETSGTTAVDTSSLANNGTYTGGPLLANSTAVPTTGAYAANFDGVNDYVAIPNEANYDFTGAVTICCWFKVDVFDVADQAIVTKGNSAWKIARDGTTNNVQFACAGLTTNTKVVSATSVNDGQWHHVAGVYTGTQLRIYIDGVLSNQVNATGAIATNNFAVEIARDAEVAGREFDGAIYNVVIYNGALDAASIAAIRNWNGLIGHWTMRETAGTTATDYSILMNNGTYTSGPTLAATGPYPGSGDKAVNFDGTDDHVATANEHYYDMSGPISVAAWIKVDAFTKQWQAIVTKGDTAWRLTRNDNNNTVRFTCNGLTSTSVSSTTSVNDGYWHHVVGVYTGTQLRMYVDGVLNASTNCTGAISRNAHNLRIANNAELASKEFDGQICDVRVYSIALTASQIAELYGLVGHWKLNQTSGTTAADSSPCAANGTVNGTASWSSDCGGTGVFDFDGSSNYVSIADASHLKPMSAITMTAWIKGDAWGAAGDVDTILRKGEASPNNYALEISDGRVELLLNASDGAGIRGNTVLTAGQWYHVAAVWDGATVRLFVNGVLDNTPPARTGTVPTDTRSLYIGGRSGADYFDGMIRDVRLYNRAMYDVDIKRMAGLVGHWAFSEGTGTTAADSSNVANNATLSGGASWTSDCSGGNNALLTNGTGGIAQTNAAFIPPDVGTVAFWMRSTGAPPGTRRILGCGADWEVRQNSDGTVISDLCGDGSTWLGSVIPLTEVGRWYHWAATFDSSNEAYAIYVDGQLMMSGTNPVAMNQQPSGILSFGTRTGSTEYWNGAIRDVRVYNRKLCPAEIAALYGLIGHWKLDETSGTSAADSSGVGNHGTFTGSPTLGVSAAVDLGTYFPSDGAFVTAPASASLNSLGASNANFTVAFWVRPSNAPGGWRPLLHKGAGNFERVPGIWLNPGDRRVHFRLSTSASNNEGTDSVAQLQSNAWSHVACVKAGSKWRLYINAVLDTEFTLSGASIGNSGPLYFGDDPWYAGSNVHMDDVRIYNRALCPSDITALEAGGDPFGGIKIIKWVEIQ
jgi:hypothetical protein